MGTYEVHAGGVKAHTENPIKYLKLLVTEWKSQNDLIKRAVQLLSQFVKSEILFS